MFCDNHVKFVLAKLFRRNSRNEYFDRFQRGSGGRRPRDVAARWGREGKCYIVIPTILSKVQWLEGDMQHWQSMGNCQHGSYSTKVLSLFSVQSCCTTFDH
jgi:hypothetical protein